MHGQIGGPYFKGKGPGGTTGNGDNTVHNTGGSAGRSYPQQAIAGPENPGPPISLRKALAPKSGPLIMGAGPGAPSKNTTAAGSVR